MSRVTRVPQCIGSRASRVANRVTRCRMSRVMRMPQCIGSRVSVGGKGCEGSESGKVARVRA